MTRLQEVVLEAEWTDVMLPRAQQQLARLVCLTGMQRVTAAVAGLESLGERKYRWVTALWFGYAVFG